MRSDRGEQPAKLCSRAARVRGLVGFARNAHGCLAHRPEQEVAGHAGTDDVVFGGRTSRQHKLGPAVYEVVITATNALGQRSAPVRLRFTIIAV